MSTAAVKLQELREVRKPPLATPLDEGVWKAWVAKGRAQDLRSSNTRVKAVKLLSIVALAAVALLSSHVTPYDVVVRFIVAAGAVVVMFQAFQTRRYIFAGVFGAIVLLYNPVVPLFGFSADWQRAVVVASAFPFAASLAWRSARTAHNG